MTSKSVRAVTGLLVAVFVAVGCTSSPAAHQKPHSLAAHQKPPPASATHDASPRPNFVFVLTDDLSWNLVSHMPHVLAMERAGTTFSRYYVVDSLCCPSRSAIFTGEYPHDDGVFTNAGADGGYFAFNKHGDQRKSFAVALHDAGYRTAMMGKYLNQYAPAYPVAPGWDEWDVAGNGGYGEFGYTLNQDGQRVRYGHGPNDYLTDVLAAKASTFIDSAAATNHPFMLEVATFAPHAPVHARAPLRARGPAAQLPEDPRLRPAARQSAAMAQGPPGPDGGRPEHDHRQLPQAGGRRPLGRRHDRRARETSCRPRAWPRTPTSCSARTTASTWGSTRSPRASRPPSRPTSTCR